MSNYSATHGWTPNCATSSASNTLSSKEDSHTIVVTTIRELFSKKKCNFPGKNRSGTLLHSLVKRSFQGGYHNGSCWDDVKCFFNEVGLEDI